MSESGHGQKGSAVVILLFSQSGQSANKGCGHAAERSCLAVYTNQEQARAGWFFWARMHLIFANVKFNEIGRMALLPPYMVLHVKGNRNLKSHTVFLKGLLLCPVFHSNLKHLLKVCGML